MVYENIRSTREDRDITQQEMATFLEVAQNTYSQYETGKIEWPIPILVKLADYYEVSVDYLLGRTNNPKVNR